MLLLVSVTSRRLPITSFFMFSTARSSFQVAYLFLLLYHLLFSLELRRRHRAASQHK